MPRIKRDATEVFRYPKPEFTKAEKMLIQDAIDCGKHPRLGIIAAEAVQEERLPLIEIKAGADVRIIGTFGRTNPKIMVAFDGLVGFVKPEDVEA